MNIFQKLKAFYNKKKKLAIICLIIGMYVWYITIPIILIIYIWQKTGFDIKKKLFLSSLIIILTMATGGFIRAVIFPSKAPEITIISPEQNFSIQARDIEIRGTVNPKTAQVTLNGFIPVSVDSDGNFITKFNLKAESNTARLQAKITDERVSEKTITINRVFTEQEKLDIKIAAEKAQKEADVQAVKAKAEQEAYARTPAGRVCTKHPTWTTEMCEAIGKGKIGIGMTEDQVKAAWGNPSRINRTTTSYGVREQWVYNMSSYVYLDEGVVTAIQN